MQIQLFFQIAASGRGFTDALLMAAPLFTAGSESRSSLKLERGF